MSETATAADAVRQIFSKAYGSRGPVHAMVDETYHAWCGVSAQLRHSVYYGKVDQVDCGRCLSALRAGQPKTR